MKEFIVPVTWEVYSTIKVEAESPEEAFEIARDRLDEIPLCSNPEYIDASYCLSNIEPQDAQEFKHVGDVTIRKNGDIVRE